ncbi:MAG: hypothetical protein C0599_14005 [Salinivirgaceae bacterium]|nr:MAG: hypothetical protein C0599_14005 [Salinivirgaceae bacterium]
MQIRFKGYKIIVFVLFMTSASMLFGQEYLDELSGNPILKEHLQKESAQLKNGTREVISLPFFDDFSIISVQPDYTKWLDQNVFINDNYGLNTPTVGVATFDAIDQFGNLYPFNDTASTMNGDTLTSAYVDASTYIVSDSLYLTFFIQGGGLGNTPQTKDSIFLQFKYKDTDTTYWKTVWSRIGEDMDYFEPNFVPFTDQGFIHDSLQFRFINKFSLEYAGMNCDHWNLDYVYLDAGRSANDSLIDEVAYTHRINRLFNIYSAVPWRAYKDNYQDIVDRIVFKFRNYSEDIMNITPYFRWTNLYSGENGERGNIANNYLANTSYEKVDNITNSSSIFELDNSDSAKFLVENRFRISETDFEENNQTGRVIDMYNYYSYDDGSAEGMYGVSNKFGMIAVKFTTFTDDTLLRAIRIYFNKSRYDENRYFNLMVWDQGGSGPGEVLYNKTRNLPAYSDTINGFVTYEFDSAVIVGNTFYIGWQKITDQRLNMGFDKNFIAYQRNYYNANGSWELSQFSGSLMIRPVMRDMFAYRNTFVEFEESIIEKKSFVLYPNPLSNNNILHIRSKFDTFSVGIYDQMGRLVINEDSKDEIDMSQVDHGVYFVRITAQNEYYTYKIIK